ncbi:MAG: radical SAM protein [Clostridia bacterium]|nr:radical SAM protein [Clostridia bacterium]
METKSVLIQSLCVPCFNRCRYCLLSWNGTLEGTAWDRSIATAERFLRELRHERPDISSSFSFGYSMEHPDLRNAIRTLRRLGSPTASFLQCDGMKMRSDTELCELMLMLKEEELDKLNFTVYGLEEYHDRFAGRSGDYDLILRMMKAASDAGLLFSASIPLTTENVSQANSLVCILRDAGNDTISLFIPHEEGRGKFLSDVRLSRRDLPLLNSETRALLNESFYRCETDWLREPQKIHENNRHILISLRHDNIGIYETRSAISVLQEIEKLDESYYAAFPTFQELAELYGDRSGDKLYSLRDLHYHYRRVHAEKHHLNICDIMDETRCGSRRY